MVQPTAILGGSVIDAVRALLERSHILGADRTVTNYAGGNTSAKMTVIDPVTEEPVQVMYVKGSGGDLGTLTETGLAVLRLDRFSALADRYGGPDREDEMVQMYDLCAYGLGGAPPSIDTPLHALLPVDHVDHVHPDSVIALAAATDGERLVKECYGTTVGWVPFRRPGFELAMTIAAMYRINDSLRGVVMGGHGLISWAGSSDECRRNTLDLVATATAFLDRNGSPEPFGSLNPEYRELGREDAERVAAQIAPAIRGECSSDHLVVGQFSYDPALLELLESEAATRLASLGTSCPDHFLRTKIKPLLVDLAPTTPPAEIVARVGELSKLYRQEYSAYYERFADEDSPSMRGADPAIVLVPGIGMFSFGQDAQTARVAGEFYLNAIAVMRGAESVSTYKPITDAEKFAIEYWALEEAKLQRRPSPAPLTGKVALITGAASGIGRAIAHRLSAEGAAVVVTDLAGDGAAAVAEQLGGPDQARAVRMDVTDQGSVEAAFAAACLAFGGVDLVVNNAGVTYSSPLAETSETDWERVHAVLARGSFLVSKAAAAAMTAQGTGGDIIYVVSKNSVVAGPQNIAYGTAKADQAHQVRLLAAELGPQGIRVNGINPDGIVRDSGIFAGEWGDARADAYGVERDQLGQFYADRTLLGIEIVPEHVAGAVVCLVSGELPVTTGAIIPVDGGLPAAFLR